MRANWGRIIAGAIVAPLSVLFTVPAAMFCIDTVRPGGAIHMGDDLREATIGAVAIAVVALVHMLVVGIPAYLIAIRLKRASVWAAGLTGALTACVLPAVYPAHVPFAALYALAVMSVLGAIVGIVFWSFVRPTRATAPPAI